jgi:hypothetical protein
MPRVEVHEGGASGLTSFLKPVPNTDGVMWFKLYGESGFGQVQLFAQFAEACHNIVAY